MKKMYVGFLLFVMSGVINSSQSSSKRNSNDTEIHSQTTDSSGKTVVYLKDGTALAIDDANIVSKKTDSNGDTRVTYADGTWSTTFANRKLVGVEKK
ncbi:MAG: hypothetical protein NTZ68_02180 [Candidatus Dependentiae bacterium]|nr:hypothetical protein [Candidatus Dependentiae bacterium]